MEMLDEKISDLRNIDDQIFQIIKKVFPTVIHDINSYDIPKIWECSIMSIVRTNFIKEAIFTLCEKDNLYCINILYRSLLEHFMKFQYIFMRWCKEKNDTAGEEYSKYCDLSEDLSYIDSFKHASKIIDSEKSVNSFNILKEIKKESSKYSKNEISNKAKQFNYKEILKYLYSNITSEFVSQFIYKILPEYSELSSYVHGGPYSGRMLLKNANEEDRIKRLVKIAGITLLLSSEIKEISFFIFLNKDKKYENSYIEIHRIIRDFRKRIDL